MSHKSKMQPYCTKMEVYYIKAKRKMVLKMDKVCNSTRTVKKSMKVSSWTVKEKEKVHPLTQQGTLNMKVNGLMAKEREKARLSILLET